jgi:hypothetical protein
MSNKISQFNREALGPVFAEGSIVTEDIVPFQLDVTQGSYYFSENNFLPSGTSSINLNRYYISGSDWNISTSSIVPNNVYASGSQLIAMSASYYTKHTVYLVGDGVDEEYFLVINGNQYASLVQAEGATLPTIPTYFNDGVVPLAAVYVQSGSANITQIEDIRPVIGFRAAGVNASAVHGNLLGLTADDHLQYLRVDGIRQMSGNLGLGGNNLYNFGIVSGSNVTTTNVTASVANITSITGSLLGNASTSTTASYVLQAVSASFATQAANATTASYVLQAVSASYALNATSASFASTAALAPLYVLTSVTSSMLAPYVLTSQTASMTVASASQALTASSADNFTVRGTLTAQTIVVQTITSSVDFVTGSTRFGSLLANTHQFTGSVSITGSLNVVGTGITGSLLGTASWANNATTASYVLQAVSSSYALNSTSASYALQAQNAANSTSPISFNSTTLYSTQPAAGVPSGIANSIFFGSAAGTSATLAYSSIFLGFEAGYQATNANNSIIIGEQAGYQATKVNNSVILGTTAGFQSVSSSYSVLIGHRAGYDSAGGFNGITSNNIIIGTNITLPSLSKDSINIGGIIFGTGSHSTTSGTPSSTPSNGRIGINVVSPIYGFDVSGSGNFRNGLTVTGSLIASNITGSLLGTATSASYVLNAISSSFASTASYVLQAVSASFATQAANATTASYVLNAVSASYALNATSASFASTAASAPLYVLTSTTSSMLAPYVLTSQTSSMTVASASQALTASSADNFTVRGTLTAQTIIAQTITSSTDFVTGSTKFGSLLANTHQFTGSVSVTGSLAVNESNVILTNQTSSMSVLSASYASGSTSASFASQAANATTASYVVTAQTASYVLNAVSSSYALNATSASYALNAVSSSYANNSTSASYAPDTTFPYTGSAIISGSLLVTGSIIATQNISAATALINLTASVQGALQVGTNNGGIRIYTNNSDFGLSIKNTSSSDKGWDISSFNNNLAINESNSGSAMYFIAGGGVLVNSTTYDGFGFDISGSARITNGLTVTGSLNAPNITGSLLGTATTASYVLQAVSASFATQAANATTASYVLNALSSSFASTASSADNFLVRGTLTAQTIIAQTITSSTDFVTGSTRFGTLLSNTHQFTGSVSITGSLNVVGTGITGSLLGTSSWATNSLTASYGNATSTVGFGIGGSQIYYASVLSSTSPSTVNVFTNDTGSFTSAFYNYTLASGSNARSGQISAVWVGGTVSYNDYSTTDIGSTLALTASVSIVTGQVQFNVQVPSSTAGWNVKATATYI